MVRFLSAILGLGLAGHVLAAPASQPSMPPHVTRLIDIRYGEAGAFHLLDLYLPQQVDHMRPLIVWIHGGGWSTGDKSFPPGLQLVAHGFALASINYRLAPQAVFPAQIHDCKAAIRFLRAHAGEYKIDPNRIGVWGASAGGHLVALLGTSGDNSELEGNVGANLETSSQVQAVCDWFGPTDLTQFAGQARAAGIIYKTPGPTLIMSLFGGSLQEKKDLVQQANPIFFLEKNRPSKVPPFLIMHGDKDAMVPLAQSDLLRTALKKAGVPVEYRILHGAGHGPGFNTPAVAKTVLDFFDQQLTSR